LIIAGGSHFAEGLLEEKELLSREPIAARP
jgi:hypothetical protein